MKLIINADDFGLSRGQNYGIIDCFQRGIVTATTLLTTTEAFEQACQLAKAHPQLDVGVHLSLDLGNPLSKASEISSLLENHKFKKYSAEAVDIEVNPNEVYLEWQRQIEKALASGVPISHLDSHHHLHMMLSIFPIFIRLAKEYNLAIRFHPRKWNTQQLAANLELLEGIKTPNYFINSFYDKTITPEFFQTVEVKAEQTAEMMCHPAYLDQWILENSSYNLQRIIECQTLQDPLSRQILADRHIELISFRNL